MIFQLTCKNCHISEHSQKIINRHLDKIDRSLQNTASDLVVLRLLIRKNIDRYHPPRARPHQHKSYVDIKPALAFFEGSMTFRLDEKQLYAHFKGQTIDECINAGFERIFKELEKFKSMHFSSESGYPNHGSIRG